MQADVLLMLAISVVLQLLLVGVFRLLQCVQGPVQELLHVSLPLLGHDSYLFLDESMHVTDTSMLQLKSKEGTLIEDLF